MTIRQEASNPNVLALTDGQRDCLRLVYNHMKSKDIARVLGVSPHTVDMRLRTAMKTLGVASRIEAARMLVQEESGGETTPDRASAQYQSLIYQAPDVAEPTDPAKMQSPALDSGDDADITNFSVDCITPASSPVVDPIVNGPPRLATASMDVETLFDTNRAGAGSFDPGPSIRPTGEPGVRSLPWGQRNDLSVGARLGWIFMIAVGSALAFGSILAALAALKTLI
ncbi:helix-turn-helix transcriptional regulator [Polymorphobacter fuscus]|uniref:helix-turn-helix transcriptional regulator n=1 Tax=Sandarakinorhabdus fusca TaxID=1439888 RepID=UPI00169B7D22|nr:helix-turn-helix transcriptional regulator [Polymorphobacter fuscus]NJC07221.1 DNA-binding CsgD family transcriptional regulator [Polymorphobacter fuscus]